MDEITKDRRICAIYAALHEGNTKCAHHIFDTTVSEYVNEVIEEIVRLAETHGADSLSEKIRRLKQNPG